MPDVVNLSPPSMDQDPVRRALDCLREGFQIIAPDWTYVYVNPAAARHGRRDARELMGKRMVEAYPGIERTPMFATLRRCMENRSSETIENEFTYPDGTTRWFEIRIQPVPEGICVYSADIDQRKRREHARGGHGGPSRTLLLRIRRWLGGGRYGFKVRPRQ